MTKTQPVTKRNQLTTKRARLSKAIAKIEKIANGYQSRGMKHEVSYGDFQRADICTQVANAYFKSARIIRECGDGK